MAARRLHAAGTAADREDRCMLRKLVFAALLLIGAAALVHAADVDVYRSEDCSCCGKWAEHLKKNGFKVRVHNMSPSRLDRIKTEARIPDQYASCHTAKVAGYVIEGHVPAEDIKRLLTEKPKAIGLSVPGMPIGSPGMEVGKKKEAYDVLLLKEDGSTEVYAKH
jgi:hypothetical protein